MSLSPQERRTILIGATIAIVIGAYMWGLRPLLRAAPWSNATAALRSRQYADASRRIETYKRVSDELEALSKKLDVEVPKTSPSDQMKTLVEEFEKRAGSSRMIINNILQLKSRARKGAASSQDPIPLKLDLTCNKPPNLVSLVKFIDSLEELKVPIAFDQISLTTTGGRSSSGGSSRGSSPPGSSGSSGRSRSSGRSSQREIKAALQIHTYLFPEKAAQ